MRHYLYVTDPDGDEIAGSRRSIDRCRDRADVTRIENELSASMGEGCSVEDNVTDWSAFWADRQ